MPLYEFRCEPCDLDFEYLCTYEESSEIRCRVCNEKLTKCISKVNMSIPGTIRPDGVGNNNETNGVIARTPILQDQNTGQQFLGRPEYKVVNN